MPARTLIVLNRAAGKRADVRRARILAKLGPRQSVDLLEGRGAALRRALARAMESRPDLVVAAGGDGTVSSCAAAVRGTGTVLAIVPGGTANSIARALGIPLDLDEACERIVEGAVRAIDVADVRPARPRAHARSMLLMATLGLHADTITGTTRAAKRRYGVFAYVASAVGQLAHLEPFEAELETENERFRARLTALTVANVAPHHSIWAQGPPELDDDDGMLDVTMVTSSTPRELIATGVHLYRSASAGEPATRDDVGFFRCRRVRIDAHPPQRLMVDGDDAGTSPVEIVCAERSLRIIAPSNRNILGNLGTS